MEFSRPPLVIAFELSETRKAIVADTLAGASDVVYLTELDEAARAEALRNAGVLLTFNTSKELRPGEAELLDGARLIQFMIGGVDFIPLGELPKGVPVATNGGGYAESMAEHALAMALASAKRLILEHETSNLASLISSRTTACSRVGYAESSALAASEPRPGGLCTASACGCTPSTGMAGPMSGWTGSEHRSGSMSSWRRPTCC